MAIRSSLANPRECSKSTWEKEDPADFYNMQNKKNVRSLNIFQLLFNKQNLQEMEHDIMAHEASLNFLQ